LPKLSTTASVNAENPSNAGQQWFALRVKSRCEKAVATIARNKGFEGFLPLYASRRRWSDRVKSIELPLFPGYVFCRLDPQRRLPLLTIPGVLYLVGVGKIPVPVDDHEIAAIQTIVQSGLVAEPWPFLELGQRVRMDVGPLTGFEGILIGTIKHQRFIASLSILKKSVAVAIEHHWATLLDCDRRETVHTLQSFSL